jgi:hypothetical protein
MGTRSLTVFGKGEEEIVVMYRQWDGYPEGYGKELAEFLNGFVIVNGIRGDEPKKSANGLDCLAAQVIKHFKTEIGGTYLYRAGTRDIDEIYIYMIEEKNGKPYLTVADYTSKILTYGTPKSVLRWIRKHGDE